MNLLSPLRNILHAPRAVFHTFAENHDLVYFGRLRQDDEQHIVRGVTASTEHTDEHYCVGTVHGYDLVLLQRSDKLTLPNTNSTEAYSWVLMQFDLHGSYDHPHVFLDGGHHNEIFYQTLFVKFARLMKVDKALISDTGDSFAQRFTAYTPPDALDDLPDFLHGKTQQTLAEQFPHFDFEWYQNRLIVYSTGRMPTKHLLEHMLRAGLWLSEALDEYGVQKISAHGQADMIRPETA